jgi:hypothetical protein
MNDIRLTHRRAMEARDFGLQEKLAGNDRAAGHHLENAYQLEAEAANELFGNFDSEPTRSVLYRSAATLARDCGHFADAEQLIHRGLSGNPPTAIAEELRDLLEEVSFSHHLELRGIQLGADEVQMAITGQEVGFGIAPTDVLLTRMQSAESLLYRTTERKRNRPYRERGRRDSSLSQLYVSVPRAACMAVTFRVASSLQESLPGLTDGEDVVDEFLSCLELYTSGERDKLKDRIQDEAYYRNFVGLARNLQPDGSKVSMVGFTSTRLGTSRQVALRKPTGEEPSIAASQLALTNKRPPEVVHLRGELQAADSTKKAGRQSNEIKIVIDDDVKVTVVVPPGMMDDIVKPLWRAEVEVVGDRKGSRVYLTEIKRAS